MAPPTRIPRAMVGIAAGFALTLVAPSPAQAVAVTLTTSRTAASTSTPVTFSGTAPGASTGTPVTLQRRLGSGSWSTVLTGGTVTASDTYSLTTYVAVGTYSYRTKVGTSSWSPATTVSGVYGRNVAVPAAGAPFTLSARLPLARSRLVKVQVSPNGSTWTTRGQSTSTSAGLVGVRTFLTSTSYVRMVAPETGSLPAWSGPRGGVAVGTDPVIKRILDDTNAERARHGKRALALHPSLNKVAGTWAYYMHATANTSDCGASFKHNPSYSSQIPSGWSRAAENIAGGQDYEDVVGRWIDSLPHHKNIDGDYTHIGIGYYFGTKCYDRYYVQNFAKY